MDSGPITSLADLQNRPAKTAPAPSKELGKDEFLKLLMAQLANQDPLQPVDNQAFIAQLAQFASVEQLHGVASRLDTLLLAQASSNQMSVASLVGKDAVFRTDGFDLAAGQAASLQASPAASADVGAIIQDSSGHVVRTLALGRRDAGAFAVSWDGRDDAGLPLPAGRYRVVFTGKGADGKDVAVEARARGRVQGVSFEEDGPRLIVGSARLKLSDVVQIEQG